MPALTLLVLLARLVAPVHAAGTFTTKADLQAALELVVCDENAAAIALHGAPDTWDVSGGDGYEQPDWRLGLVWRVCRPLVQGHVQRGACSTVLVVVSP